MYPFRQSLPVQDIKGSTLFPGLPHVTEVYENKKYEHFRP